MYPDLPILAFFVFLAFFVLQFSLLFCAFLLSFPRIQGFSREENPCFFRGILVFFATKFRERKSRNTSLRDCPGTGGGCQNFVYVFLGSFLMGKKKIHINKVPPKIRGHSRENLVYVFFLYVFKTQKTVPGRVRVNFAQNRGHEKATKRSRKSND